MKTKPYSLEIVDLSEQDRQELINHSPAAGDLLNPPPVSVWDNIPGQESWWKIALTVLVSGAAFYLAWVAL